MLYPQQQYDELAELMRSSGLIISPAEAHGIAVGVISGRVPRREQPWLEAVFGDIDPVQAPACRDALDRLLTTTAADLDADEVSLTLLLPGDANDLSIRAEALRAWCGGFLYGFGLAGPRSDAQLSQEASEALHDFAEISRMDTDTEADEESQAAITELEEYVWVAALLIHDDVRNRERKVH